MTRTINYDYESLPQIEDIKDLFKLSKFYFSSHCKFRANEKFLLLTLFHLAFYLFGGKLEQLPRIVSDPIKRNCACLKKGGKAVKFE